MLRGSGTQSELSSHGGEFTTVNAAALLVTLGAVAVGGYLKRTLPEDENLMDYAKHRTRTFVDRVKPVATRALDLFQGYVRTRLHDFLAEEPVADSSPPQTPVQAQSFNVATVQTTFNVVPTSEEVLPAQVAESAESAEPAASEATAEPEPLGLAEIFADADSLLAAYNGTENQAELSKEVKASLENLLQAYRLIEAVPQAATIWSEYIGPQIEQLKNNDGAIIAVAEELERKIIEFRTSVVTSLIRLRAGKPEATQGAYEMYDTQVRAQDQESPNRRGVFDASASSYADTMRAVVQAGQETVLGEPPTPEIARLMTNFVAKSSTATLYPDEAKKLWDMVVLGDDEDITLSGITEISESLEQQATKGEDKRAAARRMELRDFLPYIQTFRRQSGSKSIIDAVGVQLIALDQAADEGYFVRKTVEPIIDRIGLDLHELQGSLYEDIQAESRLMSKIDKLALLL